MKHLLPNKHGILITIVAAGALLWTGTRIGDTSEEHGHVSDVAPQVTPQGDPIDDLLAQELTGQSSPTTQPSHEKHEIVDIIEGILHALGDFLQDAEPMIGPIIMLYLYKKKGINLTQGGEEDLIA